MATAASTTLLPVEIVDDIICHVLSSHYWSYLIEGEALYRENGKVRYLMRHAMLDEAAALESSGQLANAWDPVVTMSAINVIFRDQTLHIGSRLLGIPRAVDGRLLEHPRKITRRIFNLGLRLNPVFSPIEPQETTAICSADGSNSLIVTSRSPPAYFPISHQSATNPWNDAATLMSDVRRVFHSGYISQSPFLKGHIAVLVGKSALATLSFGEVVRIGVRLRNRPGDADGDAVVEDNNRDTNRTPGDNTNERSPAAWALELMNLVIPPLSCWNPKHASVHLKQGLFAVAYSTHTISAICGIIGVITSCTKLMGHLRAVEAIAGIDEDRRRSMQTATRACNMSLKQLYCCESSSYQTYKPLGVPPHPPPWPEHIIRYDEILTALEQAGPEDLFPLNIRWAILRASILWAIRTAVPELSVVFPDEVVKTLKGGMHEPRPKYVWGTVERSQWNRSKEELLELWLKYKQEYTAAFGMEKLECPPEEQEMF